MLRRHGAELYVERHEATARAEATTCMLFENLDSFLRLGLHASRALPEPADQPGARPPWPPPARPGLRPVRWLRSSRVRTTRPGFMRRPCASRAPQIRRRPSSDCAPRPRRWGPRGPPSRASCATEAASRRAAC
ncbi:MAG: hypothetical protein MZW92_44915 [Comamonadaceae bacterium]|nr:hypothetical protein [Comamonadaceae bacterium]